jgi:nicotinic acid mononucleotide adenylyltransferase
LARLAQFVVIPRPGQAAAPFPAPFRGRVLAGFPLGVSSSQIRRRVKAGLSLEDLVPAAVAEAIRNNRLYL